MIKVAIIGIGKMGISHLSILGAHPKVEIVGVADTSKFSTDILKKYTSFNIFNDYKKMLESVSPDAVVVSVPTKFHSNIVKDLIERNIHVFVEKPFCIDLDMGEQLVKMVKERNVINQVGYHNKFIGTFEEVKNIVTSGHIGTINHFEGESYGPVVIKRKQSNWRSNPAEGGGCLMDYASHVIDLVNYLVAPIQNVRGTILNSIYSENVEDAVYALLETENNITGSISVNWSDETYRKMTTSITINGTKGKIIADTTELQVYFNTNECPNGYTKGWNIKNITTLAKPVDFFLRGEEYSAQIDYFIDSIIMQNKNRKNTFETALHTDKIINQIKKYKLS